MPACEMCGREAPLRASIVEGTRMQVCPSCAKFGKDVAGPPTPGAAPRPPGLGLEPRPRAARDIFETTDTDLVPDFGKRIREGRQHKGLTQEELAQRLAERQSVLSKVEAGTQRPNDALAKRLERELGIKLFEKVQAELPEERRPRAGALTLGDLIKRETERK